MNYVQCLHIILVIGKYTKVFRASFSGSWGGVGFYVGGAFRGGRDIAMKGASDSQHYLKNNKKLNKNAIFQLKVRSNTKT